MCSATPLPDVTMEMIMISMISEHRDFLASAGRAGQDRCAPCPASAGRAGQAGATVHDVIISLSK